MTDLLATSAESKPAKAAKPSYARSVRGARLVGREGVFVVFFCWGGFALFFF